jgi:hypothetical protein
MDKGLKIAGLVAAGVLLVGGAAYGGARVAQAQNPVTTTTYGFMGPGMMTRQGADWMLDYHDQMITSLAGALGMSVDDLNKELQSGKTLAQIAQEKNISTDKLQEAMLKAQSDVLAQAVKDGKLTQAQADQMLALMKQNTGMGWGFGYGGRGGMMNGFGGRGMMNGNRGGNRDYDQDGQPEYGPGFGPGMRGGGMWQYNQPQATPTPKGTSS